MRLIHDLFGLFVCIVTFNNIVTSKLIGLKARTADYWNRGHWLVSGNITTRGGYRVRTRVSDSRIVVRRCA